jgi:precorrin-2 dehydrogenase / sirohydrochlorin ferrochelatase
MTNIGYPIVLHLAGKTVLVVGAGPVGRRKVARLRAAGAFVRVVAREERHADFHGDEGIDWLVSDYAKDQLHGVALVFAAATERVNREVVRDAQSLGLFVNSASDPESGDFELPALVQRGRFSLAISTGGASPAFARAIKMKLENEFDESYGEYVDVLSAIRETILAKVPDPEHRRELLTQLAEEKWFAQFRHEGATAMRTAFEKQIV